MTDYNLIGKMTPTELLIEAGRRVGILSITQAKPDPLLMTLALEHAQYMADVRVQGHQDFNKRADKVMAQWPGAEVEEIANESWPNATAESAAVEAYDSWRQSPGHWKSCNSAHTFMGYAMVLSPKNRTYYSCGLFANCVGDIVPTSDPAPTPEPRHGLLCDQFVGVPIEAEEFLAANQLIPASCLCCKRPYPPVTEPSGKVYEGMYMEEYPLFRHKLKEGYAEEYLQAAPWSSGPMHFLGLKVYDSHGTEIRDFQWTEQEIQESL